jgi:hypothetical protein
MKNFRVLLILQILTLIAALMGASAYFLKDRDSQKGVVKGIVYTGIDSSVLIDNQVLEEGDIIYGITIEKIYPKKVQFLKNGKSWSQRVCEYPNPAWNETDEKQYSKDIN